MSYCKQLALPTTEPVSLAEAKTFCKVEASITDDDALITGLIQAAREYAEKWTGRALAQRQFVLVMDSHPYYTDTIQSQLAYPPSYYSLPRYSTTLWNYSQMIKLPKSPLKSVDSMRYIDASGNAQTLYQDVNFVVDRISEPGRIFPIPGQFWPADLYVANSVEIVFTAGYDPSPTKTAETHTTGAVITNVALTTNVLTITANNSFAVGNTVSFSGLTTATFLNGQTVTVSSATTTQFTAAFTHADYVSASDTGTAALTTPGQQPDSTVVLAIPQSVRTAILMLVAHWYANREPVTAGQAGSIPHSVENILNLNSVIDFAPTRG